MSEINEIFDKQENLLRENAYGKPRIGYFCINTPVEIIQASGAIPVRVFSNLTEVSLANEYILSNVCDHARSLLERIVRKDLYYLDAIVVTHSCDIMVKMIDFLKKIMDIPVYFINNPHVPSTSAGYYFEKEIQNFFYWMENISGNKITEDELKKAIKINNEHRDLLKKLYELRRQGYYISLYDYLKIVITGQYMPKEEHMKFVNEIINNLLKDNIKVDKIPIYLSGSNLEDMTFAAEIDEAGFSVVGDDLCTGSRYFWNNIIDYIDPIKSITNHYFSTITCPRLHDQQKRKRFIEDTFRGSKAEGVILYSLSCCDINQFEKMKIERYFQQINIPLLHLEMSYEESAKERVRTRLEAYFEALKGA